MDIKFLTKAELANRFDDFCELSRQCFTASIDANIVKQRYIDNPYDDLLMCVAEDDGKIVANYSAAPNRVILDGTEHKTALSLNTMTHPEYAGKGLFVELADRLYDYMKTQGYSFVYGFPNQLSHGIFCRKLEWKTVYEIPTLELTIGDKTVHKFDYIDTMRMDDWKSLVCSDTDRVQVRKEAQYIKWRYQDHPTNVYHTVRIGNSCWAIYHIYGSELNITEFHHDGSTHNMKRLLEFLIDFAEKNMLTKITTWSAVNTSEHMMFERYGFINCAPVRYFGLRKLSYGGDIDIFDSRNWRIYMGDDNVY